MPKDYYSILGVSKTASEEELKKAYRRLAHEHHPDKGGEAQKFKDINEAYQVLGDKQKRATYDRFGSAAFEQGAGGPGPGGFGGFGGFDFSSAFGGQAQDFGDLGDVLGEMFGFGGSRRQPQKARGRDIQVDVSVSFKEAAFGAERSLKLYKHVMCSRCKGEGAEPGTKLETCSTCRGSGQTAQTHRTVFGSIQTATTCSSCHGRGKKPEKACVNCRGTGVERREETVTVRIPAGIDNDETINFEGKGEAAAHGGVAGDLHVRIRVESDRHFEREGNDVISSLEVPFSILVLGGAVEVETLDGKTSLKISEGTTPDTVFHLRGKGIPHLNGKGRGDHHVRVIPHVPKKLTKDQRKLLEDLRKEGL